MTLQPRPQCVLSTRPLYHENRPHVNLVTTYVDVTNIYIYNHSFVQHKSFYQNRNDPDFSIIPLPVIHSTWIVHLIEQKSHKQLNGMLQCFVELHLTITTRSFTVMCAKYIWISIFNLLWESYCVFSLRMLLTYMKNKEYWKKRWKEFMETVAK